MARSFSRWKKTRKNHGRTAPKTFEQNGVQNGLARHPKMCHFRDLRSVGETK